MDQTVYCFASKEYRYVVVQHRGHAKILPWEKAFNGQHIVLLYTSLGKARQAIATRRIHTLYPEGGFRNLHRVQPLATKADLHVMPLKLTLDNTD